MEYHEGQGYLISGDIKSRKERRNKMTMEYFGKDETTIKELLDYVEKLKKKSDDESGYNPQGGGMDGFAKESGRFEMGCKEEFEGTTGLCCDCGGDKGDKGWVGVSTVDGVFIPEEKGGVGVEKVERMGMDDSKVATRLLEKTFSPLLVRKYMIMGWNMYIAIICDCSLSDLDTLILDTMDECKKEGMLQNDLQCMRNICGYINEKIVAHYNEVKRGSVEGVYVLWGFDKGWVASAYGDMMQHNKCVIELFGILGLCPHT